MCRWYHVKYEDGDSEELSEEAVEQHLVEDGRGGGSAGRKRRRGGR